MRIKDLFSKKNKQKDYGDKIGIVFSIDELLEECGDNFFGQIAYEIIFKNLNPSEVHSLMFYDGIPTNTLNYYCIAIRSNQKSDIEYIKNIFEHATDKGLAPLKTRFIYSEDLKLELLDYHAYVENGIVHTQLYDPPHQGIEKYNHKWKLYLEENKEDLILQKNAFKDIK